MVVAWKFTTLYNRHQRPFLWFFFLCSSARFWSLCFLACPFWCLSLVLGREFFLCSLGGFFDCFGFFPRLPFFRSVEIMRFANASAPGMNNAEFWETNSLPLSVLMSFPMSPKNPRIRSNTIICSWSFIFIVVFTLYQIYAFPLSPLS